MTGPETLLQDTRYALQALTRSRSRRRYTLLAVLTLGLGVGGTTAIFGIARDLLLDPLPYANAAEVGMFWKKTDWTEEEFLFLRDQAPGFRQIALYRVRDMILSEGEVPARLLRGVAASRELFDVLGSGPLIGENFRPGDDLPGAERTAVLSYGLWQQLGGSPSIVGTRLRLDGAPHTVLGVMPEGFWFPDPSVRLWIAAPLNAESRSWNSTLIGRVAPGQDVRAMSGPLASLTEMLGARFDYPAQWDKTKGAQLTSLREDLLGGMRVPLLATLSAMALILLIGCANLTVLMLVQVDARFRELALRAALGATRVRLLQSLIVEVAIISCAAGLFGMGVAWATFGIVTRGLSLEAWAAAVNPEWSLFISAIAASVVVAFLVMLVPMVSLWRRQPSLRLQMTIGGGRAEQRLIVAQVAFAVLIASGAALLGRSVMNLYAIDPGVRPHGVAVLDVMVSGNRQRRATTLEQVMASLVQLPGVRSAASAQKLPLRGGGYNLPLSVEGRGELQGMSTEYRMVTPGYLETMGFTLRDGRTIVAADRAAAERIVVINEALADRYFAGVNPIGQLIGDDVGGAARVVGVVGNAAERGLTDDAVPVRYLPLTQMPWIDDAQSIVLATVAGADPALLLDAARQTVAGVPRVVVAGETTMSRVLERAVGPVRHVMSLLVLLTVLALALGAVGMYGVIAHFAARREREWAIRIALGLTGSQVVTRIVGYAAVLASVGIAIGIGASATLTHYLSSLLYNVGSLDPIALAAAGTLLLVVGLLAAFVPARRAGTTDPSTALREV